MEATTATERHPAVVQFGRTVIEAATGDLLAHGCEGIVVAANRRGVLGPNAIAGLRGLGGSAIEREAMAHAPLELGTAVVTGPGALTEFGVRGVVHAVIHPALGEPARLDDVRRATVAALRAADGKRLRSLTIPLLGADGAGARRIDPGVLIVALVDEVVGCLRRSAVRLDRVVVVARFDDEAALAAVAIERARTRSWALAR